jgi:muconolactone delta-isomerase
MEATVAWVNQKMKEGVCLEAYVIPGKNGSAAIVEYKTAEDMNRDFAEMPVGMFMDNEVYPLAQWSSINDSIEALKRAEQMMPK